MFESVTILVLFSQKWVSFDILFINATFGWYEVWRLEINSSLKLLINENSVYLKALLFWMNYIFHSNYLYLHHTRDQQHWNSHLLSFYHANILLMMDTQIIIGLWVHIIVI